MSVKTDKHGPIGTSGKGEDTRYVTHVVCGHDPEGERERLQRERAMAMSMTKKTGHKSFPPPVVACVRINMWNGHWLTPVQMVREKGSQLRA
jgi:hypothetical protein